MVKAGTGTRPNQGENLNDRIDAAKSGDRRALARLLSSIENLSLIHI
mgnify:CR=1 FL=1